MAGSPSIWRYGKVVIIPPKWLRWGKYQYQGIVLYPFIFLVARQHQHNLVLLNHERIHIQQQRELWVLPFYVMYLFHYSINLIRYRNHSKAYFNICFEREAYANERNLHYLWQRKPWSFVNYL